jgi:hypothetical protein
MSFHLFFFGIVLFLQGLSANELGDGCFAKDKADDNDDDDDDTAFLQRLDRRVTGVSSKSVMDSKRLEQLGLCQSFAQRHVPRTDSYCPPRQKPLYLLAGQGKTGTSSLAHALTMLGLTTAHFACAKRCNGTLWCGADGVVKDTPLSKDYLLKRKQLEELPKNGFNATTGFCFDDRYDAVADTPMAELAPYIYQMHRPGDVKVVLTVKDPVEWLAKRTDHSADDHGTDGTDAAPFASAFLGSASNTLTLGKMPAWATTASMHARAPLAGAYLHLAQQLLIMCMVRSEDLLVVDVAAESRNATALWHRLAAFTNRSLVARHLPECAANAHTVRCNLAARSLPHISGPFCRSIIPNDELEGKGQALAEAHRPAKPPARPALLAVCTLFTLRFEAPYILPWIAHHRLLGVDRIILYHDDASGFWSSALAAKHSKLLSILQDKRHSDWLTFRSMAALKMSTQMEQLNHCNLQAQTLNATWVGNWDADEHLSDMNWLKSLPKDARAVIIPRTEMRAAPMPLLPSERRLCYEFFGFHMGQHELGKTIWRPGTAIEHETEGGHDFKLSGHLHGALPCKYTYRTKDECGQQLLWTTTVFRKPCVSCEIEKTKSETQARINEINTWPKQEEIAEDERSALIAEQPWLAARVYHFRYRSTSECMLKAEVSKHHTSANGWNGTYRNITLADGREVEPTPGNMSSHYSPSFCKEIAKDLLGEVKCATKIDSLKQNSASIQAFIQHTFVDGLATLRAEQEQQHQELYAFWHQLSAGMEAGKAADIPNLLGTDMSYLAKRKNIIWIHLHNSAGTTMCQLARQQGELTPRDVSDVAYEGTNCNVAPDQCSKTEAYQVHCELRSGFTFSAIERALTEEDLKCNDKFYGIMMRDPLYNSRSTLVNNFAPDQKRRILSAIRNGESAVSTGMVHGCLPEWDNYQHFDNFATRTLSGDYMVPAGMMKRAHLEKAKSRLHTMDVVLILEELRDHSVQLRAVFGWNITDAFDDYNSHSTDQAFTEEEEEFLRTVNHLDYELYDFAASLAANRSAAARALVGF